MEKFDPHRPVRSPARSRSVQFSHKAQLRDFGVRAGRKNVTGFDRGHNGISTRFEKCQPLFCRGARSDCLSRHFVMYGGRLRVGSG